MAVFEKMDPHRTKQQAEVTRDVTDSIRDYVLAFVCRTNWENANMCMVLANKVTTMQWIKMGNVM